MFESSHELNHLLSSCFLAVLSNAMKTVEDEEKRKSMLLIISEAKEKNDFLVKTCYFQPQEGTLSVGGYICKVSIHFW